MNNLFRASLPPTYYNSHGPRSDKSALRALILVAKSGLMREHTRAIVVNGHGWMPSFTYAPQKINFRFKRLITTYILSFIFRIPFLGSNEDLRAMENISSITFSKGDKIVFIQIKQFLCTSSQVMEILKYA